MTPQTSNPPDKARFSRKKKRSKAKLVTLVVAAVTAAGAFTAIEAGTSFANGSLPTGAHVTGHGTGGTEQEALNNASTDARNQCASSAITGQNEAGSATTRQNSDGSFTSTFTDICVEAGPGG